MLKPLLIGIFYRPPNAKTFLEIFLSDLKLIDKKNKKKNVKFIFLEISMSIPL